jgi:hypothetical protein
MSKVGQNCIYTLYMTIFGDVPAKSTVHTPYIYMVLANPAHNSLTLPQLVVCTQHKCIEGCLFV